MRHNWWQSKAGAWCGQSTTEAGRQAFKRKGGIENSLGLRLPWQNEEGEAEGRLDNQELEGRNGFSVARPGMYN